MVFGVSDANGAQSKQCRPVCCFFRTIMSIGALTESRIVESDLEWRHRDLSVRCVFLGLSAGIRRSSNWRRLERFALLGVVAWRTSSRPTPGEENRLNESTSVSCGERVSGKGKAGASMMSVFVDFTGYCGTAALRRCAVEEFKVSGASVYCASRAAVLHGRLSYRGEAQDEANGALPRRSREVTQVCSDRVTHAKNTPCPWARSEGGDFIRAEGAQRLCIPPTSQSPAVLAI